MGASDSKFWPRWEKYVNPENKSLWSEVTGAAETSHELVREIARILNNAGFKMVNPDEPTDKILEVLATKLPHKGNGKKMTQNAESQKKACKAIAEYLKKHHKQLGLDAAQMGEDVDTICRNVADAVIALSHGESGQVGKIKQDVERIFKNISFLERYINEVYGSLITKLNEDKESAVGAQTAFLQQNYAVLNQEMKRQLDLLAAALNTSLKPSISELEAMYSDDKNMKSLITNLKAQYGSPESANKISYMLDMLGNAARAANIVKKALGDVGMSVKEYTDLGAAKNLRDKLDEILLNRKDLPEAKNLLNAMQILLGTRWMYEDLVEEFKKHGAEETRHDNVEGAAEVVGGLKVDATVKRRGLLRDAILKAFTREMASIWAKVLQSVVSLGKTVGSGVIPLNDDLEKLNNAFKIIPDIQKKFQQYALAGVNIDKDSEMERDRFIGSLKYVISILDHIVKSPLGKHHEFKDMLTALNQTVELCDKTAAKFSEGFGQITPKLGSGFGDKVNEYAQKAANLADKLPGAIEKVGEVAVKTAEAVGRTAENLGKAKNTLGAAEAEGGIEGGAIDLSQLSANLEQVRENINYYFRVAKIRQNLERASKDLKSYGENYNKVLGDAIAGEIDDVVKAKNKDYKTDAQHPFNNAYLAAEASGSKDEKAAVERGVTLYNQQLDAKIIMYRTAESADLYMKAFTDGIVSNPNDVKSILDVLYRTEQISKWSTDNAGELICELFELFPFNNAKNYNQYFNLKNFKKHYYVKVALICNAHNFTNVGPENFDGQIFDLGAGVNATMFVQNSSGDRSAIVGPSDLPGNPYCGLKITNKDDAASIVNGSKRNIATLMEKIERATYSVSLLKNLTAMFITIGEKFGGKAIIDQINMPANIIYKNLINYINVSSIGLSGRTNVSVGLYVGGAFGDGDLILPDDVYRVAFLRNIVNLEESEIAGFNGYLRWLINNGTVTDNPDVINVIKDHISRATPPYDRNDLNKRGSVLRRSVRNYPALMGTFDNRFIVDISTVPAIVPGIAVHGAPPVIPPPVIPPPGGPGVPPPGVPPPGGPGVPPPGVPPPGVPPPGVPPPGGPGVPPPGGPPPGGPPPGGPPPGGPGGPALIPRNYNSRTINTINDAEVVMRDVSSGYYLATKDVPYIVDFSTTDNLFVMVVKSMVAKVLTVIGLHNMLHRPVDYSGLGYKSNLRTILGGVDSEPKVIPEAIELYIRLPLLVEFYRKVFNFDADIGDSIDDISILPEMDGIFGGLANFIFVKAKNVQQGEYSVSEIKVIMEEINKIYLKYKSHPNIINAIIQDFVSDVNKRYGILKSTERESYKKEINNRYLSKYDSPRESVDFEIAGIDDADDYSGPGPSMQFQGQGINRPGSSPLHKWKLDLNNNIERIGALRNRIDALFNEAQNDMELSKDSLADAREYQNKIKTISYTQMINSKKEELKHAKTEEDRFNIVQSAISNVGVLSFSTYDKSLLVFHELVVAPLNVLAHVYSLVSAFKNKVIDMKEAIDYVMKPGFNPADSTTKAYKYLYNTAPGTATRTSGIPTTVITPLSPTTYATLTVNDIPRYGIDQEKLLLDLIESLYLHTQSLDGLVELNLDVSKKGEKQCYIMITIDHSKLSDVVRSVFTETKQNLDKFRGILPDGVIEKYEGLGEDKETDKFRTIYGIEKFLIDELINGKYIIGGQPIDIPLSNVNIDLKVIADYLTKDWAGANHNFYNILSHLVAWNNNDITYLNQGPKRKANLKGLFKVLVNSADKSKAGTRSGNYFKGVQLARDRMVTDDGTAAGDGMHTIDNLYSVDGSIKTNDNARSLLISFNRLLASYVAQMYDDVSRKIYEPVIADLANGPLSNNIFTDNNLREYVIGTLPVGGEVIARNLAIAIRQLIAEKTLNEEKKQYSESNLAEIPAYLKEKMKAQLPAFRRLFEHLNNRCTLIFEFVRALDVSMPGGTSRANVEKVLLDIIKQIKLGCTSVIQCINKAIKDLSDDPKFMETYNGFIQGYVTENKKYPFMPLSSVLYYIDTDFNMLPTYRVGEDKFKFAYGSRKIINSSDVKIEDTPGLKEILKLHNQSTDIRAHFDEKTISPFIDKLLCLLRFSVDQYYKPIFGLVDSDQVSIVDGNINNFSVNNLLNRDPNGDIIPYSREIDTALDVAIDSKVVYQLSDGITLNDVIALTEGTNQREKVKLITNQVNSTKNCPRPRKRESAIAFNIIDMNIVPININAVMREIPLANLINYSYNFDHIIEVLLNEKNLVKDQLVADYDDLNLSGKRLLAYMAKKPYIRIQPRAMVNELLWVMKGLTDTVSVGRPRFLSDDIYNMSLLGSIYDDTAANVIGPKTSPRIPPAGTITYPVKDKGKLTPGSIDISNVAGVADFIFAGFQRFNTYYIRNLLWLGNVQNLIKSKLRQDLVWYDDKVISKIPLIAYSNTEIANNDAEWTKKSHPNRY